MNWTATTVVWYWRDPCVSYRFWFVHRTRHFFFLRMINWTILKIPFWLNHSVPNMYINDKICCTDESYHHPYCIHNTHTATTRYHHINLIIFNKRLIKFHIMNTIQSVVCSLASYSTEIYIYNIFITEDTTHFFRLSFAHQC